MKKILDSISHFNRREQTLLFAGALLIVLYVLWLALLAPLQHKRERLLSANIATEQTLGRVQLLVSQMQNLSQQSNQTGAEGDNINGIINTSLNENGLSMSNFTPSGSEVRVRIDKANAEALLQWLYDLEVKHHIAIRELSITASNDPGQVAVTLRLAKQ